MNDKHSIQIICSFPLLQLGIASVISEQPDLNVVAISSDMDVSYRQYLEHCPDICILDLMPCLSGVSQMRKLRSNKNPPQILALSCQSDSAVAHRMISEGANGFISQRASNKELVRAIRTLIRGETYIEPSIAQSMVIKSIKCKGETGPFAELTEREMKVCQMIIDGIEKDQISARLHLAPKTVANYHTSILSKLNVKNDLQLLRLGIRSGIVTI